jgi:DNA-binding transcriptional LysR family regulator
MMKHIDTVNEPVGLSGVDLNLLHVFHSIMIERSVTRAGQRVGLTQSATSNALARLRVLFGDALFVKTPAGMIPTPRAQSLAEPIQMALHQIATAVRPPKPFDPAQSQQRFILGMSDYVEFTLLPSLVRFCARDAPEITLTIRAVNRDTGLDLLDASAVDITIGYFPRIKRWHASDALFSERWVCVGCDCNDALPKNNRLTLKEYLRNRHLVVNSRENGAGADALPGDFDEALLRTHGLRRRVAASIPHFLAAPFVIERTPLLATIEERLARRHLGHLGLRLFALPFDVAGFEVSQVWHRSRTADPAHLWLRQRIKELALDLYKEQQPVVGKPAGL